MGSRTSGPWMTNPLCRGRSSTVDTDGRHRKGSGTGRAAIDDLRQRSKSDPFSLMSTSVFGVWASPEDAAGLGSGSFASDSEGAG